MTEIFSFGEWVRRRRKALDLTQDALARQVGCALSMIRKIEADERRPSRQIAELLATALAVPATERDQFLRTARAELSPDRLTPPATSPSTAVAPTFPTNLPAHLPTLIGRDRELAELAGMLHDPAVRLVTLTGPGGTGKTSLALRLATELLDTNPDGVWFVDLAPISDPQRVAPTIVQALGLPESSQSESATLAAVWERLARWLASQRVLLVLDNFEQVLDAAPQLAYLLDRASHTQVIVTSRIALRLTNEREYPVAPLRLPALHANVTPQIVESPAVQLFIERARAARPGFVLTDSQAAAVSTICTALDGLPLAIELAAARVRIFSPADLLSRLTRDGGLALLTVNARDRPARQQTIRAAITWSYDLLGPLEQRLFRRLGVFVGGWTLALAEATCDIDSDLGGSVLDALQLLVEHSLVQHSGESEPSTFHMLETVRAFAFEHLTVSGEESILRNQHLAACVAFAEQAEPQLRSAAQLEWLSQIDHVYDNLRAALVWGLDQADDPERLTLGLRLAGSLWYYWYIRGRSQEAFRWLDHSAMADERLPVALRAHALLSHWFIVSETLQPEGFTTYVYGLALAERAGDPLLLAHGLLLSGDSNDWPRGWALAQIIRHPWWHVWCMFRYTFELSIVDRSVEDKWAVLTAARAIGDGVLISIALVNLSMLSLTAHDFRMAQQLAEEALATVRRLNFTWGLASVLYALTRIKELQGDVTAAHAYNLERYAVERQLDNPHGYTDTLQDTIRLAIWQADYQQAADLSAQVEGAALTTWKIFGVFAAWISAWLAVEQGHHNAARILAQEAQALCDLSVTQHFQTRSFMISGTLATGWLLGTITAGQGRHDQAIAAYEATLGIVQALTPAEQLTNSQALQSLTFAFSGPAIVALSGLGRIAAYHPDQSFARTWLNQTLAVIRTTIDIWEPTIARAVWGRAYLGWGEYTAAAAQFSDDLRFYHKAGARRAIAEALEGLAACAGAKGQWEFAVRWWAAADQLRTAIGAPLWPVDQADREQRMAQARTQLSPGAFEAAWVAGQALSLDHAVAEALAFTDLPAS